LINSVMGAELLTALHGLVASPHKVIPYTHKTKTDTWDALRDLDVDPVDPNRVMLIYKQTPDLAENQGVASGWNRENIWPKSFGASLATAFPKLTLPATSLCTPRASAHTPSHAHTFSDVHSCISPLF